MILLEHTMILDDASLGVLEVLGTSSWNKFLEQREELNFLDLSSLWGLGSSKQVTLYTPLVRRW
jgi:hypothetical protein